MKHEKNYTNIIIIIDWVVGSVDSNPAIHSKTNYASMLVKLGISSFCFG